MPTVSADSLNRVLSKLTREDFDLLRPHLEPVDLPVRKELEGRNRPIDQVYFIEQGLASVAAGDTDEHSLDVGLIGREGITGLAVIMGTDRSPNRTVMRLAGRGQRIASANLRDVLKRSATLHRSLLRFGHAFFIQATRSAMANGHRKIEERLARWILMAHDRVEGHDLSLTHDVLAAMLGVRRPGVTVALRRFESGGLIKVYRGGMAILDRNGLQQTANGGYGGPETEYRRLFGSVDPDLGPISDEVAR